MLYALCLCLLTVGCSVACSSNNVSGESNVTKQPEQAKSKQAVRSTEELRSQLEGIAREAEGGRVGVAATVLETGESIALKGDEQFPMQSVYKFPIGMVVLHQVDEGKLKLEQHVRVEKSDFVSAGQRSPLRDQNPNGVQLSLSELLRFMVSESDGTASDVLLKLVGGPQVVMDYLRGLGIKGIVVANTEKEFAQDWTTQYRNWATPLETVALLRALQEGRGLSQQSRALMLKLLIESPTGPKRLKGLLPANAMVAHKTGTSGSRNGVTAATNDVGLITLPNGQHIAIAVFVSDSKADEATRESIIAKTAQAVWNYWSR